MTIFRITSYLLEAFPAKQCKHCFKILFQKKKKKAMFEPTQLYRKKHQEDWNIDSLSLNSLYH